MGADALKDTAMPVLRSKNHDFDKTTIVDKEENIKMDIVWSNIFKFIVLHTLATVGLMKIFHMSWATIAFSIACYFFAGLGITAGAHRLWAHRSYKAKFPLRLFLTLGNLMAGQNSIYVWARDHRAHHKFSETDGDPHNSNRGFFFAHMGWLLVRKHPEVTRQGSKIDLSDLEADPLVKYQHKYYTPLSILLCFVIPTVIPWYLWQESIWIAYVAAVLRYVLNLHATWLVNSAAHLWGDRPYDVSIAPSENRLVSVLAIGEGFHNYHHTFPQDYSVSEWRYSLNFTTFFIDLMAHLGQAYACKTMSKDLIQKRIARTGPDAEKREIIDKEY